MKRKLMKRKEYERMLYSFHRNVSINFEQQLIHGQAVRTGDQVPKWMILDPLNSGGFHFGQKRAWNNRHFIGKPQGMDGHILINGGPGSYKTAGIVKPTLLTWMGHVVLIDIKPQSDLLAHCIQASKFIGKHIKIFNPTQTWSSCYDPYVFLRSDGEDNLSRNAKELAIALLPPQPEIREQVWRKAAQNILTAVIIYYFDIGATFGETMTSIISSSAKKLINDIEDSNNEISKLFISKLKNLEEKTLANIDMELTELTIFAADSRINSILCNKKAGSNFIDWNDLNYATTPYNTVLQIPEEYLDVWEPVTKLLINQLIRALGRRADKYSVDGRQLPPILIILEEFASLGKIPSIINGLSTLRSRGVTFCLIVQSFCQLDEIYGSANRRVIVDNCAYKAILNVSDPESQKYFSDLIGSITTANRSSTTVYNTVNRKIQSINLSINESHEPIVYPHELNTLGNQLILITPEGFCRVDKATYIMKNNNTLPSGKLLLTCCYK